MREGREVGPVGLLLWCGVLLGVSFPLGKVAAEAGVSPVMWALLVSLGASLSLMPFLAAKGLLRLPRGKMLRYVVISGMVSFAGINLMIFGLVPKVGAGQVGMMFALSPVATLAASLLFGMKAPNALGIAGIIVGLVGALMVAFGRGGVEGTLIWSLVALSIPVVLAAGNVYRSLDWPAGAHPMALAFWAHLVAVVSLIAVQFARGEGVSFEAIQRVPGAAMVQLVAAALTFPAYFKLQKTGGPVLLSQIGYIAAALGLLSAVVLLGERYGPVSWIGAGITAVGIAMTIAAQTGWRVNIQGWFPIGRLTRAKLFSRRELERAPQQGYLLSARRQAVLKLLRQA
ncbi:drug/metabolite transporter (DMT)-like permease [Shimia isoporae]|uniref:Drug/metabolite transporter (DMT)-like permease n=1 Tax=Shimia isoporae TaxID=647720 RepID=A0A4R1NP66_9RHOB|nr:DMT family transporter [Shimia isoporae]TCL09631.1 drug/metabolite transporter (DMT)-like permease [Shimia isoporae]